MMYKLQHSRQSVLLLWLWLGAHSCHDAMEVTTCNSLVTLHFRRTIEIVVYASVSSTIQVATFASARLSS
jgi:hypothetical protein